MEKRFYKFNNGSNTAVDLSLIKCASKTFFSSLYNADLRMYQIVIDFIDGSSKELCFSNEEERDIEYNKFLNVLG